jgi:hypothetical protein
MTNITVMWFEFGAFQSSAVIALSPPAVMKNWDRDSRHPASLSLSRSPETFRALELELAGVKRSLELGLSVASRLRAGSLFPNSKNSTNIYRNGMWPQMNWALT